MQTSRTMPSLKRLGEGRGPGFEIAEVTLSRRFSEPVPKSRVDELALTEVATEGRAYAVSEEPSPGRTMVRVGRQGTAGGEEWQLTWARVDAAGEPPEWLRADGDRVGGATSLSDRATKLILETPGGDVVAAATITYRLQGWDSKMSHPRRRRVQGANVTYQADAIMWRFSGFTTVSYFIASPPRRGEPWVLVVGASPVGISDLAELEAAVWREASLLLVSPSK